MKKLMLFAVCSSFILSSCFESGKKESKNENQESKEDKSTLCVIKNVDDDVSQCEDGQLLVFLPNSWGNDQLPIEVAAYIVISIILLSITTAVLFVSLIERDGKSV